MQGTTDFINFIAKITKKQLNSIHRAYRCAFNFQLDVTCVCESSLTIFITYFPPDQE